LGCPCPRVRPIGAGFVRPLAANQIGHTPRGLGDHQPITAIRQQLLIQPAAGHRSDSSNRPTHRRDLGARLKGAKQPAAPKKQNDHQKDASWQRSRRQHPGRCVVLLASKSFSSSPRLAVGKERTDRARQPWPAQKATWPGSAAVEKTRQVGENRFTSSLTGSVTRAGKIKGVKRPPSRASTITIQNTAVESSDSSARGLDAFTTAPRGCGRAAHRQPTSAGTVRQDLAPTPAIQQPRNKNRNGPSSSATTAAPHAPGFRSTLTGETQAWATALSGKTVDAWMANQGQKKMRWRQAALRQGHSHSVYKLGIGN